MSHPKIEKVKSERDRALPVFDEFEKFADKIRARAFELFSRRGGRPGNDLEDWLVAEKELCWPTAELREKVDSFEIDVALAGFHDDEITVTALPDEVIVKARHVTKREDDHKDEAELHWSGFSSNEVFRRIELPTSVDVDALKASFKGGMLSITARKAETGEKSDRKRIKISSVA